MGPVHKNALCNLHTEKAVGMFSKVSTFKIYRKDEMKAEYLRAGGHKKTAAAAAHISLKEFSLASNNKGKLMSSYWVQKFTFS